MSERDAFARLLARHLGDDDPPPGRRGPAPARDHSSRWLDDRSRARILDASLDVLAAVRTLTKVAEEVLRDRRNRLLDHMEEPAASSPSPDPTTARERIPLSY